jgi:hypothetical protein
MLHYGACMGEGVYAAKQVWQDMQGEIAAIEPIDAVRQVCSSPYPCMYARAGVFIYMYTHVFVRACMYLYVPILYVCMSR